ncbi:MAG: hypothetical protein ABIJ45_11440, partial [Candidatus Zixiibacteriota bacterium]
MIKRKSYIIAAIISLSCFLSSKAQVWSTSFNGIDSIWSGGNPVIKTIYNDGDSVLYIGGPFIGVNTTTVNGIFKWNGTQWNKLDGGFTLAATCESIQIYDNKLFAGGGFWEAGGQSIKYFAIWDGSNWYPPQDGQVGSPVIDMKIYDTLLFLVGNFTECGSTTYNHVVATDGNVWINVGSINSPWATALEIYNGELIMGEYNGMRKYLGGTTWENFPGEPLGWVNELCVDTFNNFLYAGGDFYYLEDWTPSYYAAMWDGFKWNSLGIDLPTAIPEKAMAVYRGDLFIGSGMDTLNNGLEVNGIVRWNGSKWDSVGCGTNNPVGVKALEIFRDTMYVGGYFSEAGGLPAYGLAKVFVPDTGCGYLKPKVLTIADTFYMSQGEAQVQFYNNNAYVQNWDWNFGDGNTANIKDPLHSY